MIPVWAATDVALALIITVVVASKLAYRLGVEGREHARREACKARALARRAERERDVAVARWECAQEVQSVLAGYVQDKQRRIDEMCADFDRMLGIGGGS